MKIVLLITFIESAIVAVLMILWRFRKVAVVVPVRQITSAINIQTPESRRRDAVHSSRWAFINGWTVEPQTDDRRPALGGVGASTASASG